MTRCMPFSRQRNKASGQSLRLQWRTFAADIMAVRLQKTVIDATMWRGYRLSSFVTSTSPTSNLAYITSVFIKQTNTRLGSLIKRFAAKKAEEDGRNSIINVRRSSICWRGRREPITNAVVTRTAVMMSL